MSKDWSQKWQSGHSKYHWHDTSRHGAVKGALHLLSSVGHSAHGAQHTENFKHRFSPSKLLRHPWRLLQTHARFGRRRLLGQISFYSSRNKEQELLCFPRSFSFDFKPLLPCSSKPELDTMLPGASPTQEVLLLGQTGLQELRSMEGRCVDGFRSQKTTGGPHPLKQY